MNCPARAIRSITLIFFGFTLMTAGFSSSGTSGLTGIIVDPGISRAMAEEENSDDQEDANSMFCDCTTDSDNNDENSGTEETGNSGEEQVQSRAPCSCGNGKTGFWARKDGSDNPVVPGGSAPRSERQIQGQ